MLELYHHGSSVCAAKVRLVLEEKGVGWTGHYIDILKGEQFDPDYLKLNPKAVVPTLVHDGEAIRESTLICEYLDEVFPDPPLKPADPLGRVRMRSFTKMVDEKIHEMCAVLTFTASHRVTLARMTPSDVEDFITRTPDRDWGRRKRDWIENGLACAEAAKSVRTHDAMLADIEKALGESDWLAGGSYSLADIGLTPYVNRLDMLNMLDEWSADRPRLRDWFDRIRARPNFEPAINKWLPDDLADDLRNNGARAWPEVKRMLATA